MKLVLQSVIEVSDNPCNGCYYEGEFNCIEMIGDECSSADTPAIWVEDVVNG